MKIQETLRKPMTEAKYLTVDNTDRYRPIIRLFYINYEKLNYWLYQEEVYDELKEDAFFCGYTPEQCQQDLTALTGWGNLLTTQDTRRVRTIEEFKNKKFRYQLSRVTVEIERMVLRVENLLVENSSLEPTLLERIAVNLGRIPEMREREPEAVYAWWNDLNNDFMRLNQNYRDYLRELSSVKAEEMMQTREFLVFKDRLIEYLNKFVRSLQMNASVIEQRLKETQREAVRDILEKVTEYELSIPRIDGAPDRSQIYANRKGCWESICAWFSAADGEESEVSRVFDKTNDIIRRITRYAARISELSNSGANRREEYRRLAELFSRCGDIDEAHRLAAAVFGMEKPLHLRGLSGRQTESINSGVFDEKPEVVTIAPRVRTFKEKAQRTGVVDRTREKEEMRRAVIRRQEEERRLLQSYITENRIDFAALPEIEPQVRDVFLGWLSRALESRSLRGKTEDGRTYRIENADTRERCVLRARDGAFRMPAYVIRFEDTR